MSSKTMSCCYFGIDSVVFKYISFSLPNVQLSCRLVIQLIKFIFSEFMF